MQPLKVNLESAVRRADPWSLRLCAPPSSQHLPSAVFGGRAHQNPTLNDACGDCSAVRALSPVSRLPVLLPSNERACAARPGRGDSKREVLQPVPSPALPWPFAKRSGRSPGTGPGSNGTWKQENVVSSAVSGLPTTTPRFSRSLPRPALCFVSLSLHFDRCASRLSRQLIAGVRFVLSARPGPSTNFLPNKTDDKSLSSPSSLTRLRTDTTNGQQGRRNRWAATTNNSGSGQSASGRPVWRAVRVGWWPVRLTWGLARVRVSVLLRRLSVGYLALPSRSTIGRYAHGRFE